MPPELFTTARSLNSARLAAEALRIRMAGLHDPMVAVSSSAVEPLPHQIRAHSMLALWHLASGRPISDYPQEVQDLLGSIRLDRGIRRVVLTRLLMAGFLAVVGLLLVYTGIRTV
jgi:hypothetical protein